MRGVSFAEPPSGEPGVGERVDAVLSVA